MSKNLHDEDDTDNDNARAMKILDVFCENSWAENTLNECVYFVTLCVEYDTNLKSLPLLYHH